MKLAFVLRRFGTDGGTERYSAELARYLVARGHSIDVWCAEHGEVPDGVRIRALRPAIRGGGPIGAIALARAAAAVRLADYDVVQGFGRTMNHHVWRAGGGAHAAYLRTEDRSRATRAMVTLRLGERIETWIDQQAARRARIVVANSEMAKRDLVREYALPADRVRVVRNGIDARFTPDRRESARQKLGIAGRIVMFVGIGWRRKGLGVAAQAFAKVASGADRFVIVGRDAHPDAHLKLIRGLLGDRLVVHGPSDAVWELLPAADAVILPTRYDAAANTTAEALASGVPAITSAMDGNAEIVPDPALIVSDPGDVAGFAAALGYALAAGADLRDACREAAIVWPVSRNGEAMEALYEEIARGSR